MNQYEKQSQSNLPHSRQYLQHQLSDMGTDKPTALQVKRKSENYATQNGPSQNKVEIRSTNAPTSDPYITESFQPNDDCKEKIAKYGSVLLEMEREALRFSERKHSLKQILVTLQKIETENAERERNIPSAFVRPKIKKQVR